MCGIVGLLIRKQELRPLLGKLALPMFVCMADRGPDSGGLAVFGAPVDAAQRKFNVYAPRRDFDWAGMVANLQQQMGTQARLQATENHAVITSSLPVPRLQKWISDYSPGLHVLSVGRVIDLWKDIGHPSEVAQRYGFAQLGGSHCVGHTRMATESAVTPAHCHPFTAGEDFCLVHNGSLSNPYSLRRRLERLGVKFETDNDTEAACRFIEWRLREGDTLEQAIVAGFAELDGFYTLLMATRDRLLLVRDAFACKPAVVAEHEDYVAVSSEFRALAHLPGIQQARIFEPMPEEIYSWQV